MSISGCFILGGRFLEMHDVKQRLVDELMITFGFGQTVDCISIWLTFLKASKSPAPRREDRNTQIQLIELDFLFQCKTSCPPVACFRGEFVAFKCDGPSANPGKNEWFQDCKPPLSLIKGLPFLKLLFLFWEYIKLEAPRLFHHTFGTHPSLSTNRWNLGII